MVARAAFSRSVRSSRVAGSGGTTGMLRWMPDHVIRVAGADGRGDLGAPVAALGAVAGVAEPAHQLVPGVGDLLGPPARPAGLAAEAVAGQRRADHVESVRGVAAVRRRIGERPDDLAELDDRARPAVRDDQRQRVLAGRADVQEVDVQAVDLGAELREAVQPGLGRPPVVAVQPVLAQFAGVRPAERPGSSRPRSRASGHRVRRSRSRRSSRSASGTSIRNGVMSSLTRPS